MALQREQVVQTAEKYVSRGKIEPAIREYRKLLAENPNDINTLNRIGDLYARIQRIDEAVEFFNQIGQQYADQGFFVKAIAIYKKIIKLDPTRLEVYERLADLYHKQNLVTEARTQYQVLADYYTKHDNAASAIAIYNKMAELEPENPSYHVKLAEIYQQQKLFEKAINEYRIIAELMIQHGRTQEAAQVYERALSIDSKNLRFVRSAIETLRAAGADDAAAHFLSVAIERNPEVQGIADELRRPRPVPVPEPEPEMESAVEIPEVPVDDASIELEIDLGDDLMAAMREAEAAVSGKTAGKAAPEVPELESEELELDLDQLEELVIELPDALPHARDAGEDAPASLVRPPAGMDSSNRPAWAREPAPAPVETTAGDEYEIEFDVPLEMGELTFEVEGQPAAPETYEEAGTFILDGEIELEALPEPASLQAELPALSDWEVEETSAPSETEPAPAPPAEPERDELITEAEVLAKYGLEEKALERLEEALRQNPESLSAYALMIRLHLDRHRHEKVFELARRMSDIASRTPEAQPWQAMKGRLLESGYRLDGDEVIAGPHMPEPQAPAPPPPAPPPAPVEAPRPVTFKKGEVDDLLRGILGKGGPAARKPAPPAPVQPKPAAPPPVASAPPPAPPPAPAPPAASPPAPKTGLFDLTSLGSMIEAEEDLGGDGGAALPSIDDEALWAPAPPPAAPAPPQSLQFGGGLEDSGVGWLDEAEAGQKEPAAPATSAGTSGLFDEEDDFFDLAGELVEELSKEEVFQDGILVQQEQSLEEIVEGFKKGVAEHLSPTDYDTHYNLGIAYREMGLLDEAIGEFQLAAKDSRHLVICCSMLGLCFLDKGLPELSIKWYRRGLEAPGVSEDDHLGLMYDLGNAYMAMGDDMSAYGTFVELYGINTNYRDVVAKLAELRR
ncbi:MAG TPA: tetratricopeptide repeat protein [Thermoanaerobaculia bacterium]|nr:tetratricopeptide repeat protein [Thermoanaerobaculia bacterium]